MHLQCSPTWSNVSPILSNLMSGFFTIGNTANNNDLVTCAFLQQPYSGGWEYIGYGQYGTCYNLEYSAWTNSVVMTLGNASGCRVYSQAGCVGSYTTVDSTNVANFPYSHVGSYIALHRAILPLHHHTFPLRPAQRQPLPPFTSSSHLAKVVKLQRWRNRYTNTASNQLCPPTVSPKPSSSKDGGNGTPTPTPTLTPTLTPTPSSSYVPLPNRQAQMVV